MARVLVADDELGICRAFAELLQREGHEPLLASNGHQALQLVEEQAPELVFMDIQMPGMTGLEALSQLRQTHPGLPVVVMTAYGTMDTALEAVQLGAFDYIGKPVELAQVRKLLQRALHKPQPPAAVSGETAPGDMPARAIAGAQELMGQSAAMQELFKLISLLTGNDLHVLVTGETGVGKELVATAIHRHSPRSEQPFVAVNCAAIPENLVESELFGHEKGSFTGANARRVGRIEAAGEGTLFLDEISELALHLQSKLLRVLQERSYEPVGSVKSRPLRARVIAASNLDLREQVERGTFREDLYHRLNLVTLHIPPLRQRLTDIPLLAEHFLHRAAAELNKNIHHIEPRAISILEAYSWPGNVREMEHSLKRAVLLAPGPTLTEHDLDLSSAADATEQPPDRDCGQQLAEAARQALHSGLDAGEDAELFHSLVCIVEQALVKEALVRCDNNQVAAARMLGLHRTTLRKKLEETPAG